MPQPRAGLPNDTYPAKNPNPAAELFLEVHSRRPIVSRTLCNRGLQPKAQPLARISHMRTAEAGDCGERAVPQ